MCYLAACHMIHPGKWHMTLKCRVALGITPQSPHGSGRAEFPHPALQTTDFAEIRYSVFHPSRYSLESRYDDSRVLCLVHRSLQQCLSLAAPSLHRVSWGEFPGFLSTTRGSDFRTPIPTLLRFVAWQFSCNALLFAPMASVHPYHRLWVFDQPAPRPVFSSERCPDLPGSWGILLVRALFLDPGRASAPGISVLQCCLPLL